MRTMVSKTLFRSPGERAMMLRISAVAAWRSRVLRSSCVTPAILVLELELRDEAAPLRAWPVPLALLLARSGARLRLGIARRFGALFLARRPLPFELPFLGPRAMSTLRGLRAVYR